MDDKRSNSKNNEQISKRQELIHSSYDPSSGDTKAHYYQRDSAMALIIQDEDLMPLKILPFLDVVSLVGKKAVCKEWEDHCSYAIDGKTTTTTTTTRKSFEDKKELKEASRKYIYGNRDDLEDVVVTYGYPIDKWDVSKVTDFSNLFKKLKTFNEDIGSWNTSNATDMSRMFFKAKTFNKDISRWDVSNVRNMERMLCNATSFNGNLAAWDVCNVSTWDVSSVTNMYKMFDGATSFDRESVSNWDISGVRNRRFMFGEGSCLVCDDICD